MEHVRKLCYTLVMAALLWQPSPAQAQFQFRTFGGPNFPSFGGYGYGGFGNFGGFGRYGFMPGYVAPFGAVPGISYNYGNPGWSYASPYYANGFSRPGPVLVPGFSASEAPRSVVRGADTRTVVQVRGGDGRGADKGGVGREPVMKPGAVPAGFRRKPGRCPTGRNCDIRRR